MKQLRIASRSLSVVSTSLLYLISESFISCCSAVYPATVVVSSLRMIVQPRFLWALVESLDSRAAIFAQSGLQNVT